MHSFTSQSKTSLKNYFTFLNCTPVDGVWREKAKNHAHTTEAFETETMCSGFCINRLMILSVPISGLKKFTPFAFPFKITIDVWSFKMTLLSGLFSCLMQKRNAKKTRSEQRYYEEKKYVSGD